MKLRTKIATLLLALGSVALSAIDAAAQEKVTVKQQATKPAVVTRHVYKTHHVKPRYGYKRTVHTTHKVRQDVVTH